MKPVGANIGNIFSTNVTTTAQRMNVGISCQNRAVKNLEKLTLWGAVNTIQ